MRHRRQVARTLLGTAVLAAGMSWTSGPFGNADFVGRTTVRVDVAATVAQPEAGVGDAMAAATVPASDAGEAADCAAATIAPSSRRTAFGSDPGDARKPLLPPVEPGRVFRDRLSGGGAGPAMVVIPSGRFRMGCLSNGLCLDVEKPVHEVTVASPFALSVHEVTFEDFDRFTYPNEVDDEGWGRGRRPVINVSWNDAQDYVAWLSAQTGASYRLPSESEWEYAARAGTKTKYSWGDGIGIGRANCRNHSCNDPWENTAPVGSFQANGFGLYDMHGNVNEWVEDCWNESYAGAPSDGTAWMGGDCTRRVLRGGSWYNLPWAVRAALRYGDSTSHRSISIGFRVARTLTPQAPSAGPSLPTPPYLPPAPANSQPEGP